MSKLVYPTCQQCGNQWRVRACDLASGKSSGTLCPMCRNLGENNPNYRHGCGHDNYRYKLASIARYPERNRIRMQTRYHIKAGHIKVTPCAQCGGAEVESHHYDYKHWSHVIFLCRAHHREADKILRKGLPQ